MSDSGSFATATADQPISGIPRLLPVFAMQPKIVMCQKTTWRECHSQADATVQIGRSTCSSSKRHSGLTWVKT